MSRLRTFSQSLLAWFDVHGRKNLPWQQNRTAYRVWLSEIMLQQTQVATVIPYFERFIENFPTVQYLADASGDEVMRLWAGLGYYARARNLHACAQQVAIEFGGVFPGSVEELQQLPGIGRSTAGAIVAQAYGRRAVILDGNVKRVLSRYRMVKGWPGTTSVQKRLWELADELTPDNRAADYTQAIMDLGATLCRRVGPSCEQCPIQSDCRAFAQGEIARYPDKKPRRELPTKETFVLLCYYVEKPQLIMLIKRPPSGVWGGLWSLPQCDITEEPAAVIAKEFGYVTASVHEAETMRHTFSHFHLRIRPLLVQLKSTKPNEVRESAVRWCDRIQVSRYGMPKPIVGLVHDYFERVA